MFWRLIKRFWMEGIWARVLLVAVMIVILEISPVPQSLLVALEWAEIGTRAGDHASAAEAYYRAYQYQPWNPEHLAAAAGAELRAGHYGKAEEYLNELQAIRPLTPHELIWLGSIYAGQGRTEDAIAMWEAGHAQGAIDADSITQLTEIYFSRGEWERAGQTLESLITHSTADAQLYYRLGLVQALDQPEQASVALAQAVSLDESLSEPLIPIRNALLDRAEEPDDLAYARLGVLYLDLNELTLSEAALSRAVALNPSYGEALAYLAYVRSIVNKPSLGASQQALALAPASPIVHYMAGLVWNKYDRVLEARAEFEQAFTLDPKNPAFAVEIASTYRAQLTYEWAEIWMAEAAYLAGNDLRFQILLVQFYVDEEYLVEEMGLPLALALVQEAPDNALAYDALGWAYFLTGQPESAAESLNQALTLDPSLARIHLHLGIVLESQGQTRRAMDHYIRAAELEPDGPFGDLARRALERLSNGE